MIQPDTISRNAVIYIEEPAGTKVAAARVSFCFCPSASASLTVQVLSKDVAAKRFSDIMKDVAAFAAQVTPEAIEQQVPFGMIAETG